MRAAVCHRLSDDRSGLRIETDWPDAPPPGPGEVSVRMHYAALNYPDLLMLGGGYQYAPPLPFVPGVEGCGVIDAVGEGLLGDLVGERVIVGARSGCLTERMTVAADAVRHAPEAMTDQEAAAHTVGALTAYVALVRCGRVRPGERVLVAGSGGGMGLAAVALAKAIGVEVVAAASSPAKLDVARAAGAHEVLLIDRNAPDYSGLATPVDVVFDPVGHAVPLLRSLRWGGRCLVIGFVGGIASVPLNRLLLKGIEIIGVRAGEFARRDPAAGRENIHAIDALATGGMRPHIGMTVALEDVDAAFAAMAAGSIVGKAVIDLR